MFFSSTSVNLKEHRVFFIFHFLLSVFFFLREKKVQVRVRGKNTSLSRAHVMLLFKNSSQKTYFRRHKKAFEPAHLIISIF